MAPARVVSLAGDACAVDVGGRVTEAATLLSGIDDLAIGDWVLVAGGAVVRRLQPAQAEAMTEAMAIAFAPTPRNASESEP